MTAALAIPHKELRPRLQKYCFNEWMIRALQRKPGFEELPYRLHQIYFINEFSRRELSQELSTCQFSQAFDCHGARANAALANRLHDSKIHGRYFAFDGDSENEILKWIEAQAEKCKPITRTGLRHYCEIEYSRSISRRWINSFILRYRDDSAETENAPHENTRFEVPRTFLDEMICCLREHIQRMKA
jgi:hypothetical protein